MKPIARFSSLDGAKLGEGPVHLAIGMFDGVHLGHRAVIGGAVRAARAGAGASAVMTFRPHPSALFRPDRPTRLILDSASQAALLERLDVDAVVTQPFTREFAAIPAGEFAAWLKARVPRLAALYVGRNFRFGAGRQGDGDRLAASAGPLGVAVVSVPPVEMDGAPVNSTRIRGLLAEGDVAAANALLGYAYFARGRVVAGRRLGRSLGFPTLNLDWEPDLKPRFGVYAVSVAGLAGVANYGLRPTVEAGSTRPRLEVHLLEACPFGAGDELLVEWRRFIRPEMKFGSIDELRARIAEDAAAAAIGR
ncbi:MAG: riboflavin biosynthesis protein RibF [Opitutaceae bacterium]